MTDRLPTRGAAMRIAAIYAVMGALWILLSGRVLHHSVEDAALAAWLENIKGWFYVLVTAAMLGWGLDRYFREIRSKASDLRKSEARFEAIFNATDDAIFLHDAAGGRVLDVNDSMLRMYGFRSKAEFFARDPEDLFVVDAEHSPGAARRRIRDAVERGPQVFEWLAKRADGERFWVEVSLRSSSIGGEERVLAVVRDITGRKQAEAALRASEERLGLFIENAPIALAMFDRDMRYLAASRRWREEYEITDREVVGSCHYDLFPQLPERWRQAHRRGLAGEIVRGEDDPFTRSDGTVRWARWEVLPWQQAEGGIGGILICTEDVTARVEVEKALRESEERMQFALSASQTGTWSLNLRDRTATRSRIHAQIFGYADEEGTWSSERFLDHVLPEEREQVRQAVEGHTASRKNWNLECRIRRADGEVRWIFVAGGQQQSSTDSSPLVSGIVQDITVRKRAERALEESRERFRALVETTFDWIWEIDERGRYTYVSPNSQALLGYAPEEVLGKTPFDFMPESEARRVSEVFLALVAERKPFSALENVNRHRDGHQVILETSGVPVFGPDGGFHGYRGMDRDITARKRIEAERETMTRLLELLNVPDDLHTLMRNVTALVRERFGCEAAGIRLREGDDFPYFETRGFPAEFVRMETRLCRRDADGNPILDAGGMPCLDCMCGNVLCGRFDPAKPFFTARGSFWANDTTRLLATTTPADRQANTRNRCNGEGYESVGLFALRANGVTYGLLQVNDRRPGLFTPESLMLLERMADSLAVTLAHRLGVAEREALAQQRQLALDAARMGWWSYDPLTRVSTWDDGYRRIFGVTGHARPNDEILAAIIHPDDLPAVWANVEAALNPADPQPFAAVYRIRRADDGRLRWIEAHGLATFEGTGTHRQAVSLLGTVADITERRQAEDALRDSEARLRLALESAQAGTWEWDLRTDENWWSEQLWPLYGLEPGSCPPSYESWQKTIHPEDRAAAARAVSLAASKGIELSAEWRVIDPDGGVRWLMSRGQPVQDPQGRTARYRGIVLDITDRKRVEEALRAREAQLATALSMARAGHWEYDVASDTFTFNDHFYRIFHTTAEAVGGYTMRSGDYARIFCHPDDAELVRREVRAAIETSDPHYGRDMEHRILYADGGVGVMSVRVLIAKDEQGRTVKSYGVNQDVTEAKRAEEALRTSEERYRSVFENAREGMALADIESGILVDCNPALCRLVGRERSELVGQAQSILHPEESSAAATSRSFQQHRASPSGLAMEDLLMAKDGRMVSVEISATHIHMGGRDHLLGIFHDLTERRQAGAERERLEAQLHQAQKLEAVGQLAGGVAHDFNNILFSMMMMIGLLEMTAGLNAQASQLVKDLGTETQRAAALTRQLLMFSRRSVLEVRPLDLNEVVRNLLKMLSRLVGEHIRLTLDAAPVGLPPVSGDAGLLEQVIMNLVVNARDAMPRGGRIVMATSLAELTGGDGRGEIQPPARPVRLPARDRYGHRHGWGNSQAHFRALFHHQGPRPGHGPGSRHRARHRRTA
jgi:PAS domain S-box-containing protein